MRSGIGVEADIRVEVTHSHARSVHTRRISLLPFAFVANPVLIIIRSRIKIFDGEIAIGLCPILQRSSLHGSYQFADGDGNGVGDEVRF